MRSRSLSLLLALVLLAPMLLSCGDGGGELPRGDRAIPGDHGGSRDASATDAATRDGRSITTERALPDRPPAKAEGAVGHLDAGGAKQTDAAKLLTCVEITDCVQLCTSGCAAGLAGAGCMLSCNNDCTAKGCTAAQGVYAKVSACVQQSCLLDCLGGSAGCQTCVQQKCATQAAQCAAQGC